jgi:fatty-acyl-CoA synthase
MSTIFRRAGEIAREAAFAARVLDSTGLLSALSPSGVWSFARASRGIKPGPHVALMLHARNKPEKLAVVDGRRRISYGDFDREVNQLAHGLADLGVGAGDRVAFMMPNRSEYLAGQHACIRLGAIAVQIGYHCKGPEIAYILGNAEPQAVVVHHDYLGELERGRAQAAGPDAGQIITVAAPAGATVPGPRYEGLLATYDGSRPPAQDGAHAGGVIIYTSGTTGNPKGANRDWKQTGLEAVGDFMAQVGLSHDDIQLVVAPLYHSAAPAFSGMCFSLGGSVVLMDHFDAEAVLATIERERVTGAFMVPTMLLRLLELPERVRRRHDLSSLRWIVSGAAPLPTDTARRFQDGFGYLLWNFYGATETGLVTLAGPDDHVARPGTVGRALRGNELRILDPDGEEVGPGEIGELYVRNSMLITGYHRNDDATRDAMREGFFSVGDMARLDADGYLYLESRKHDMVISGGVNIYPAEIENHLTSHPDIDDAAVIGVPDPEWGESLKAFVVRRRGSSIDRAEVDRWCKDSLAGFKRPRQVEFVDELPRNPTGKVLKRQLRERS